MNINRSGFYKWLNKRSNPSTRQINRDEAYKVFKKYHDDYPFHG